MILIVGCGYLGSCIAAEALKTQSEKIVCAVRSASARFAFEGADITLCDVTDKDSLAALLKKTGGEELKVFYLAANHFVDRVFESPEEAKKVNIDSLKNFLDLFSRKINRLFYASTDCVYGENTAEIPAFLETSPLAPVNEYGRQKLEAEKAVRDYGFTALRLPFMAGESFTESKKSFYDNICKSLQNGEKIEMIDGMRRNTLSYKKAASLALSLMNCDKPLPEIINVAGDRAYTKYETGLAIAKKIGADPGLVKPISFEEGQKFFKDKRADNSVMSNALLKETLGLSFIPWEG